jgi:hypothetical protein
MTTESSRQLFARWRLDQLLVTHSGLCLIPTTGDSITVAGTLGVNAHAPGKAHIVDEYQIELSIPNNFPRQIPSVRETAGRIPRSYHKLQDGALCLGSPTQLLLILAETTSIVRFVERCLIPYLYRYSHLEQHGFPPFGDLGHGPSGIRQDLMALFGTDRAQAVLHFVQLASLNRRDANKQPCPCGSGRRLGRCHNRSVNRLRDRLGRFWFRQLHNDLKKMRPQEQA